MAARKAGNGLTTDRMLALAGDMTRTGVRSGEMGMAAAQTIGYRTAMMAAALGNPIDLANPEFVRMGSEKVEAAVESVHALAKGVGEFVQAWTTLMGGQFHATMTTLTGLGQCRTPSDFFVLQHRSVQESVEASLHAGFYLMESVSNLTSAGLAPVHRTVRANARRLGRLKR